MWRRLQGLTCDFLGLLKNQSGGETWAETIPVLNVSEDGTENVNWKFGLFIMLYVLVLNWCVSSSPAQLDVSCDGIRAKHLACF